MLSDFELIDTLHSEPLTHPSDFNINTFHKKEKNKQNWILKVQKDSFIKKYVYCKIVNYSLGQIFISLRY